MDLRRVFLSVVKEHFCWYHMCQGGWRALSGVAAVPRSWGSASSPVPTAAVGDIISQGQTAALRGDVALSQ